MAEEGRPAPNLDFDTNRIYVGNLNWKTSWQDLKDFFNEQIGGVEFTEVLRDTRTGRSKGCGIVEFSTNEDAKRAVKELQGFDVDGREIFLREDREPERPLRVFKRRGGFRGRGRSGPRFGQRRPRVETGGGSGRQIFIGNLNFDTTEESIEDQFAKFGTVEELNLERLGNGRSRGMATLRYETKEQADAAIEAMHDEDFEGRPLIVHTDKFFAE